MEIKSLASNIEYSAERFTKRILFKKDNSVVFVLNFEPGQELPTHKHPGTAVYLLVIEGGGDVIVNGETSAVKQGDAIWVDGEDDFAFRCSGSVPASLYVVLAKIPDERYAQNI